jgi:alcohol oxidase
MLPDDAEYVSMANWTAYPYSRGHIHITSPDVNAPIDFDVGYLKDENEIDLKKHLWAYKLQRDISRRMPIWRGELASTHPRFPEGSKAAVIEKADGPIKDKIEYTKEDDKAIEQKIREIVTTVGHILKDLTSDMLTITFRPGTPWAPRRWHLARRRASSTPG